MEDVFEPNSSYTSFLFFVSASSRILQALL